MTDEAMTEEAREYLFTSFSDKALKNQIARFHVATSFALPMCRAIGAEDLYGPDVDDVRVVHLNGRRVLEALRWVADELECEEERAFLTACLVEMGRDGIYMLVAAGCDAVLNVEDAF